MPQNWATFPFAFVEFYNFRLSGLADSANILSILVFLLDRLFAGQTVDVSNGDDAEIPNEPPKSKSKTKSKKGASKATPRNKERR